MSLSPGHDTFTVDRLRQVWREGRHVPGSYIRSRAENFEYDSNHNLKHNRKFCLSLQASVQEPAGHFSCIDKAFAPILKGDFRAKVSEDAVRNLVQGSDPSLYRSSFSSELGDKIADVASRNFAPSASTGQASIAD